MRFIISDVEGTLTTGSSWKAMRTYYKTHFNGWVYNRFFLRWVPRYLMVALGIASRRRAMFDWMAEEIALFRGMKAGDFDQMAAWIVEEEMWPKRRQEVFAEIEQAHKDGVRVVVVSGAYQPIVEAFAKKMNAIAIGTPLLIQDGKVCGIADPINAYEHKVARLQERLDSGNILAAYGDTASDIPMMELSHSPVAVYPDAKLRKVAEISGWRVITDGGKL
jgi:phosphoserine phosphatase